MPKLIAKDDVVFSWINYACDTKNFIFNLKSLFGLLNFDLESLS